MHLIFTALIVSIGINLLLFVPAFIFKTDRLTDISYSITFVALAIFGYEQSARTSFHALIMFLVLIWAIRLGGFLFIRINKIGKDVRFDGMRDKFIPFLRFWLLQGTSVFVIMLAALLGYAQRSPRISLLSWIGAIIFVTGLLIEAIADAQKFRFKTSSNHKGQWIDIGIWRASRHPNYLGEMMVWLGLYIVVAPSLGASGRLFGLLSPAYIIALLLFISGIPLLEKSARKKWGDQAAYAQYEAEVPLLIPRPRSIRRITK